MHMPKQEPPGTMHRLAATGLAASLLLAAACEASAGVEATQSVRVTAVVKRHAAIRLDAPQSLTISEQDVARGYVDVPSPMEVTVSSNVPQGAAAWPVERNAVAAHTLRALAASARRRPRLAAVHLDDDRVARGKDQAGCPRSTQASSASSRSSMAYGLRSTFHEPPGARAV
ncbi:MAG: hypothetical protein K0R89_1166 [Ramlibacter sp.]|nr:hypothetical protein [Ramlibacter sp.]